MNQTEGTDISPFFHLTCFFFSFHLRQWKAGWKQPASVTASPALVLYGLAGSNCLLSTTLDACWSTDTTTLCECWASPMQPPGRQSSPGPGATVRASALLTWSTWKSRPASAEPPATPRVRRAVPVSKTPAVRACAADAAITQPCTSPACPVTARYAGAATWSVRHVCGRRRCIPAKTHDKRWDRRKAGKTIMQKKRTTCPIYKLSVQDLTFFSRSLQNCRLAIW